jgi:hypothetical protein
MRRKLGEPKKRDDRYLTLRSILLELWRPFSYVRSVLIILGKGRRLGLASFLPRDILRFQIDNSESIRERPQHYLVPGRIVGSSMVLTSCRVRRESLRFLRPVPGGYLPVWMDVS